jgi:hypothetical protein
VGEADGYIRAHLVHVGRTDTLCPTTQSASSTAVPAAPINRLFVTALIADEQAGAVDPGQPRPGGPGRRDPGRPQPGAADPAGREGALAAHPQLGHEHRSRVRPKRTRIVELYLAPPPGSTVICADELGPVIPRLFPPAPGWSPDGHRIKAPLEYSRGPEKTWAYGGLRVAGGQAVTLCAPSCNSAYYQAFLQLEEQANPEGTIWVITGNLSSHDSKSGPGWKATPASATPFIPKGACWLNLQEAWWRIFRRQALAGHDFTGPDEIAHATRVATAQLNARARPWVWGRLESKHRCYRRRFVYML